MTRHEWCLVTACSVIGVLLGSACGAGLARALDATSGFDVVLALLGGYTGGPMGLLAALLILTAPTKE